MKKRFLIEGMQCSNCAMILDGIEDDLAGVNKVVTNYHKGEMVVEYNPAVVTDQQIIEKIEQLGYKAKSIA